MELDQYNIKEFQDGLEDILKNPWKKPVCIQDSIPTFPEENNTLDRTKHDLIKVVFVLKRFMIPYYYIIWHLCLNKAYFLKYILDVSSKDKDFVIMFDETSRLTSHEIYEAFISMSSNNASFLLDKIKCPISIYSKLKEALAAGEESKFAEAIDGCNLSSILPAIKFILAIKSNIQMLESTEQRKEEVTDLDSELEKQKIRAESELTEKYGVSPNSQLYKDSIDFYNGFYESFKEPDVFLDGLLRSLYPRLFYQYCQMKEDGGLNESDIKAFEYIFHQPAFEEQYNENLKLWKDGTLKDRYAKRSDADSPAKEEPQSTPQIEEPAAEEVKEKVNRDEENDSVSSPKTKERWRLQKYLCRKVELDKKTKLPYCKGFKKSIVVAGDAGDRALTMFIQYLADHKYIDDDKITKNSFAYALTGRGHFRTGITTVKWHPTKEDTRKVPESVRVLLYISSFLFDLDKTEGKTYSQLFNVLEEVQNPYIKDGKNQSPAYYDSASDEFVDFCNECFGQFTKKFNKKNLKK